MWSSKRSRSFDWIVWLSKCFWHDSAYLGSSAQPSALFLREWPNFPFHRIDHLFWFNNSNNPKEGTLGFRYFSCSWCLHFKCLVLYCLVMTLALFPHIPFINRKQRKVEPIDWMEIQCPTDEMLSRIPETLQQLQVPSWNHPMRWQNKYQKTSAQTVASTEESSSSILNDIWGIIIQSLHPDRPHPHSS